MYGVLIADDEPFILEGLSKTIPWEDYNLELKALCLNGEKAWQIVNAGGIDIVITDIRMPQLDGIGLLMRICEQNIPVKCIILSGYNDFAYVKECARLGIENYLLKPVNMEECISTLENIVAKLDREQRNQKILTEGIRVLKDNIIQRWMTGQISDEELNERCELLDIHLDGGFYAAILYWKEPASAEMIRECMNQTLDYQALGYVVAQPDNRILILFHVSNTSDTLDFVRTLLKSFIQLVMKQLHIRTKAVLGDYADDYRNVCVSMRQAYEMLDYQYIRPNYEITAYKDYICDTEKLPQKTSEFLEKFSNVVAGRNREQILQSLVDIFKDLNNERMKLEQLRNICILIVICVIQNLEIMQANATPLIEEHRRKLGDVCRLNSFDELLAWTVERVHVVLDISEKISENYSEPVLHILNYIEMNYAKEMNLKTIAGDLEMNALYLGQLFYNETGEHFTEYLNKKRIEISKQLLLQNISVKEVALQVGYMNSNYFYTIFKKYLGQSPNEYRVKRQNTGGNTISEH